MPEIAGPLPRVDPYRVREPYAELINELLHAESAALQAFASFDDPNFVWDPEPLRRTRAVLMRDEETHVEGMLYILKLLGSEPKPPRSDVREFWTSYNSGRYFQLPLAPFTTALFTLFPEALAFAILYYLSESTTDPEIRRVLTDNLADEKTHLQATLRLLQQAYLATPDFALLSSQTAQFMLAFNTMVGKVAASQRQLMERIGIDSLEVAGCGLRYARQLALAALTPIAPEAGNLAKLFDPWVAAGTSPLAMRAMYLAFRLPEPSLLRPLIVGWAQANTLWSKRVSARQAARSLGSNG